MRTFSNFACWHCRIHFVFFPESLFIFLWKKNIYKKIASNDLTNLISKIENVFLNQNIIFTQSNKKTKQKTFVSGKQTIRFTIFRTKFFLSKKSFIMGQDYSTMCLYSQLNMQQMDRLWCSFLWVCKIYLRRLQYDKLAFSQTKIIFEIVAGSLWRLRNPKSYTCIFENSNF